MRTGLSCVQTLCFLHEDLVEHCKDDPVKDAMCKMNVGITSAFVVTTIAGVLSNGLQKAAGHDDEDKGNETDVYQGLAAWGNQANSRTWKQ